MTLFKLLKTLEEERSAKNVLLLAIAGVIGGETSEYQAVNPDALDGVEAVRLRVNELQSQLQSAREQAKQILERPIPMILFCPSCGVKHVDAPDERTPSWTNPPHKSHLCHGCGHIWRPCDRPTEGVKEIATVGKADSPALIYPSLAERLESAQQEIERLTRDLKVEKDAKADSIRAWSEANVALKRQEQELEELRRQEIEIWKLAIETLVTVDAWRRTATRRVAELEVSPSSQETPTPEVFVGGNSECPRCGRLPIQGSVHKCKRDTD